MLFKFEIIVEPCEIRELVFGSPLDALAKMTSELRNKVAPETMLQVMTKAPEINESGQVVQGNHRVMATADPPPAPAPAPVPFDVAGATKTLTDLRTTLLKSRDVLQTDTATVANNTAAFNKEVKTIGSGLGMKVGEEKYLTTTIGTDVYVIKFTQPTAGVYGCQFIKQA